MSDNSIYASLVVSKVLSSFRTILDLWNFYHLASLPYLFYIHLMFMYLSVRFRLSSVSCSIRTYWIRFVMICFLWRTRGSPICLERVMRNKRFRSLKSFGRTSPSMRLTVVISLRDLIRIRLTFANSIFEDENFLFRKEEL